LPDFLRRNIHRRDTEFAEYGIILIEEIFRGAIFESLHPKSAV